MGVTYRHGISILQLIIYAPSFFLGTFLVFRHGLRNNSGFVYLSLFCVARIVGACSDLATISDPSTDLFVTSAICSSIGLSPLMLACAGLLSRANESIKNTTGRPPLNSLFFNLFRLLTLVSMILSIVGITENMSFAGLENPNIKVKIGMILYLVSWAQLCLYLAILAWHHGSLEKGEHRTVVAVAVSAPFILVRVLYAMLVWFLHNGSFNIFNGDVTVQLVMSVLEEFAVVIACLAVGITLRVRAKSSRTEEVALPTYRPTSYAPKH